MLYNSKMTQKQKVYERLFKEEKKTKKESYKRLEKKQELKKMLLNFQED